LKFPPLKQPDLAKVWPKTADSYYVLFKEAIRFRQAKRIFSGGGRYFFYLILIVYFDLPASTGP